MATIKQFKNIKNKLKLSDFSDIIRANNSLDNTMSVNVIKEHIEITPGICGGKPRIAGHRIRVQDIVIWHEQMGMSPDEILYHYPSITLSDVYAALAYYHDHREEIRQQISESEALIQEIQAQTPSILQQKLKKRNDREN
jgi:uncharacterized protein (DUF433 family)